MKRLILIDSTSYRRIFASMIGVRKTYWCQRRMSMLPVIAALILMTGCGPEGTVQKVEFSAADSLLGDTVIIDAADIAFRLPAGFRQVPLEPAHNSAALQRLLDHDIDLDGVDVDYAAYYDSAAGVALRTNALRVSSIDAAADTPTDSFRDRVTQVVAPGATGWTAYETHGFRVHNLLFADSNGVQYHLLLFPSDTSAVNLHYHIPQAAYADMLAKLESSIGSLHRPSAAADTLETH